MARKPASFLKETDRFWVLAEYMSKSNPGKDPYHVRTSKTDGKTYCTCRGWIVKLNQSKETGGRPECTHIKQYRKAKKDVVIEVMNFEDFTAVKRGIAIVTDTASVSKSTSVRRK